MQQWISRLVLGTIAPVVGLLTGWWGTYLLGLTDLTPGFAVLGLVAGLLADATVLRHRLDSLYALSLPAQLGVAGFYTVMIYGFFMGFPVPVLLVSLGWGYAAAHKLGSTDRGHGATRWASLGSAGLMLVACLATAWLAFREPWIAGEVRGMLGLPFTPSVTSLAVATVFGALLLVASSYLIPKAMLAWRGRRTQSAAS